jgi:hypothetical protein
MIKGPYLDSIECEGYSGAGIPHIIYNEDPEPPAPPNIYALHQLKLGLTAESVNLEDLGSHIQFSAQYHNFYLKPENDPINIKNFLSTYIVPPLPFTMTEPLSDRFLGGWKNPLITIANAVFDLPAEFYTQIEAAGFNSGHTYFEYSMASNNGSYRFEINIILTVSLVSDNTFLLSILMIQPTVAIRQSSNTFITYYYNMVNNGNATFVWDNVNHKVTSVTLNSIGNQSMFTCEPQVIFPDTSIPLVKTCPIRCILGNNLPIFNTLLNSHFAEKAHETFDQCWSWMFGNTIILNNSEKRRK